LEDLLWNVRLHGKSLQESTTIQLLK
jgi:hypothetical protein